MKNLMVGVNFVDDGREIKRDIVKLKVFSDEIEKFIAIGFDPTSEFIHNAEGLFDIVFDFLKDKHSLDIDTFFTEDLFEWFVYTAEFGTVTRMEECIELNGNVYNFTSIDNFLEYIIELRG